MRHISVMLKEVVGFFLKKNIRIFFDATLGVGGHAKGILSTHPEITTYIGCDRDLTALKISRENLRDWKEKLILFHGNFKDLESMLFSIGVKSVDGFFLIWESHLCILMKVKGGLVLGRMAPWI